MRIFHALAVWLSTAAVPVLCGQTELSFDQLDSMSLEDLLNVNVLSPASITRLGRDETPASLTSLTAEDIQRTPARNLMDLIEIYVPGAIWMNFDDGPVVGIRGSVSAFNNKYLLIVNGKLLNSKGIFGGKSELELWDLGDIKQLDIIRGPGSVTYGPSAVAGVISITTQDAGSMPRTQVSAGYLHEYGSTGGSISQGNEFTNVEFLAYASIRRTTGELPLEYQGSNNYQPGYIGRDIQLGSQPLDYLADYKDIPQAKLYGQVRFLKDWNFWARYTQQGTSWSGNEVKTPYNGQLIDLQGIRDRQFSTSLEFKRQLNPRLDFQAEAGAMLFDVERRTDALHNNNPDDPMNFRYNFSESEYIVGSRINYRPVGWLEAAMGGDFAVESTGPGWFEGAETMITGGDGVIYSGPETQAFDSTRGIGTPVYAGDGWTTRTFDAYVETKFELDNLPTLLLSGRADKNTYSQWLLSPRAALIGHLPNHQTLKAIVQRSEHRNESGELFIEHQNGTQPSFEVLRTYELIHQAQLRKSLATTLSVYYNDADVVSWNPVVDHSLPLGNLRLVGMEAEVAWEIDGGHFGANYSLLQQVDWVMAPGVIASGISYSDYNQPLRGAKVVQQGYGSDLNNWPNQALKCFGSFPLADNFSVHGDVQLFWDYQGAKDGLAALDRAAQGTLVEPQVEEALDKIRDEGVYGLNTRINLSAQYKPTARMKVNLSILNLMGTASNARYAYDEGNTRLTPHRVRYIREDRAVGLSVGYSL